MAKKKKPNPAEELPVEDFCPNDELFDSVVETVQTKLQKEGMLVGHNPVMQVLPVPAFSMRYLIQNEGLPLSCMYQAVGPEASYKSTFAMEVVRWHRLCGGRGLLCEAETKPTSELRNSVLNWDLKAVDIEDCETFEDWQRKLTRYTVGLQKRMEKAGTRDIPWCAVVDSLTGKASEHTLKNIQKVGHANLHFPVEARQMADYMRAYPQMLLGWPFTFVGVNHMKINRNPDGTVDYNIPGGWALKFQCSAIFELEKMGGIKEFNNYKAATIRFSMLKNSYGADDSKIKVRFKTWLQEDAPDTFRLHSRFEWWEASILFIATGNGLSAAKAQRLVPKMKEACDIHEKSGGSRGKLYWSNALGVPSSEAMPPHDLGMILETKPDVLKDLYNVTGIQRRQFFRPGVDFLAQQEAQAHVIAQADASDLNQQRLREIQQNIIDHDAYPSQVEWPSNE